jgi:hypothetical protein
LDRLNVSFPREQRRRTSDPVGPVILLSAQREVPGDSSRSCRMVTDKSSA